MKTLISLTYISGLFVLFAVVAKADWFGFGTAATAIAEASWKIIAINAIKSAQFVILMVVDVTGLILITSKFLELAERITQDNKVTIPERWLLAGAVVTVLISLSLLVPLGFYLITRLFS